MAIHTLAGRPELTESAFSAAFAAAVPEFMRHDPVAALYYDRHHFDHYREFALTAVDPAAPDRVVARALSLPFAFGHEIPGRAELPDGGWDEIIRWADEDRLAGRAPNAVSALEIIVLPPYRGRGVSLTMLMAVCGNARRLGFADLYAPVRPSDKHREPFTPFAEYGARTRPDGLPADPWVRVHLRAGGTIVRIAPTSMVIAGTIAHWAQWTGSRFDTAGPVVVPGALSPVHAAPEQDHAVYVEPNLWIHHRLAPASEPPGLSTRTP